MRHACRRANWPLAQTADRIRRVALLLSTAAVFTDFEPAPRTTPAIRRGLRFLHIVPWLAMCRIARGTGLGRRVPLYAPKKISQLFSSPRRAWAIFGLLELRRQRKYGCP